MPAGKAWTLRWLDDFVGVSQPQTAGRRGSRGTLVFVGHGITAPEFKWDDFKGVDVKGKILILFTNEPPSTDPKFFDGPGADLLRPLDLQIRRGAAARARAGAIIIHTTPTASYGWDVVRNSWGRETPFLKLGAGGESAGAAGRG